MQTLVIVSHPDIQNSYLQTFLKAAQQPLKNVTWHEIKQSYNVAAERSLLLKYDRIILQFPLYWYQVPGQLKLWLDDVLTGDFVFDGSTPLKGKELGIVFSTGIAQKHFQAGEKQKFSFSEMLRPFEMMANQLEMHYYPNFAISQFHYATDEDKAQLLINYQQYLTIPNKSLSHQIQWLIAQMPESEQRALLISEIEHGLEALDDLNWQIKAIRLEEGDG